MMKAKKEKQSAKVISLIRVKLIGSIDALKGTCLQF
jgi:hypothetical protein